jgi:transcriptional regulator with XRE-family HTH domain
MEKENLKKRRERLGLTQTELAKILGFASNTVSGYETGRLEIPKFMDLVLEALEARQIKDLQSQIQS